MGPSHASQLQDNLYLDLYYRYAYDNGGPRGSLVKSKRAPPLQQDPGKFPIPQLLLQLLAVPPFKAQYNVAKHGVG